MMVMMFGGCKANTILVLLTRFVPLSPSIRVALANGNCKATFANINCCSIDVYQPYNGEYH
jgi:hypothetical protein